MIIDGPIEFGSSRFDDFFDSFNTNSITLNSTALVSLNGLKLDEDGSIFLQPRSITNINGDFDTEFLDLSGAAESIEGDFELRFE
mgnify:CR=1 FL=1